jgi:hypothetical protein
MVHKAHDARRNADFTTDSFAIPRHVYSQLFHRTRAAVVPQSPLRTVRSP